MSLFLQIEQLKSRISNPYKLNLAITLLLLNKYIQDTLMSPIDSMTVFTQIKEIYFACLHNKPPLKEPPTQPPPPPTPPAPVFFQHRVHIPLIKLAPEVVEATK